MAVPTNTESGSGSAAPAVVKKGRGLSFEEKRKRLSEYFLEKVNSEMCLYVVCFKDDSFIYF